jgi:serine/threonine-protein kinase
VRALKSPLTPAVDVYSLGATLYGALAGRPPFEGKDAVQVSKRVMIEEPPPVEKVRPDVPEAVGAIVRRAMAKDRGLRFPTAQEMADALRRYLDSSR